MFSCRSNTEVQQWLVDWPSGEGRLWHRLHPEPTEAGEHPAPAGAEKGTLPRVSRPGRRGCGRSQCGWPWIKWGEKSWGAWGRGWGEATVRMSKAWQVSWQIRRLCCVVQPLRNEPEWLEFSIRWWNALEMLSAIIFSLFLRAVGFWLSG